MKKTVTQKTAAPVIATTIGALVNAQPALEKLIALPLGAKVRYHAVKLWKKVHDDVQAHFFEPRNEAIKELGAERDPTGAERAARGPDKIIELKPENMGTFQARVKELVDVPVVIEWGPLTHAMLEPYEAFTGADMLALGPLFELDPMEPMTT